MIWTKVLLEPLTWDDDLLQPCFKWTRIIRSWIILSDYMQRHDVLNLPYVWKKEGLFKRELLIFLITFWWQRMVICVYSNLSVHLFFRVKSSLTAMGNLKCKRGTTNSSENEGVWTSPSSQKKILNEFWCRFLLL